MLCNQEQESWAHLWRCPHLLPRLAALQQATKKGFEDLLSETVPNRSTTFTTTWDALPCWSLPTAANTNTITFDYLIRGVIPSSLLALLMTVLSRKDATDITNNIGHIAQSLFRDEIWNYRCEKLAEWETSKGISQEDKRASSAGFTRWRDPNTNISPSQAPISRWKSWIAQAIDTGRPWLGFQVHINSLVLGLVHHLF
jgi:hypothetical protein